MDTATALLNLYDFSLCFQSKAFSEVGRRYPVYFNSE